MSRDVQGFPPHWAVVPFAEPDPLAPHNQRGCLVVYIRGAGYESGEGCPMMACVTCDAWIGKGPCGQCESRRGVRPSDNRGENVTVAMDPCADFEAWRQIENAPEDKHVQAIKDNLMGGKR